ncbi:hypothetical protein BHE74_00036136 [Ensete ventricosum]|nr:hypothetical protein BHE74_00036136 [Ensete ventricosum]
MIPPVDSITALNLPHCSQAQQTLKISKLFYLSNLMDHSTLTASDDNTIPAINSRPFPLCGTALSFIESSHHFSVTYLPLSATPFATMAKHLNSAVAVLMAVACVLPSLAVAARNVAAGKQGFVVQGRVFCDTCRAGFETPVSTYTVGEGFPSMQAIIFLGRERARVFLSRNNGIASDTRYANSLGFQKDTPLSVCAELLKNYEQYEV